tara:strand:+ start:477 stop:785 length:309 start_codon:yes stop_codon:yes gene_type:complete
MNIQNLVKTTLAGQMATLGEEPVIIGAETVQMILAEADNETAIMGGKRDERRLTGTLPTDASLVLKTGAKVTTRGQTWKIESVSKGQAMTSVTMIEPNRAEL